MILLSFVFILPNIPSWNVQHWYVSETLPARVCLSVCLSLSLSLSHLSLSKFLSLLAFLPVFLSLCLYLSLATYHIILAQQKLISSHLSLNREGRWSTTDEFTTSFLRFSLRFSLFPTALLDLEVCPFSNVVFPPLPLSALSSSPLHWALQDGFGQTWWIGDIFIPQQFASLYNGHEVFVWSDRLLDLGMDFLVCNMVFV